MDDHKKAGLNACPQPENEWWFAVEDVVLALIDSQDPKQYNQRMKLRDPELQKGWVQFVHTLGLSRRIIF